MKRLRCLIALLCFIAALHLSLQVVAYIYDHEYLRALFSVAAGWLCVCAAVGLLPLRQKEPRS